MFWVHFELGRAYEQKNMFDEATTQLNKAITIARYITFGIAGLGHAYAVSGQTSQAQEALDQLKQLSKQRYALRRISQSSMQVLARKTRRSDGSQKPI